MDEDTPAYLRNRLRQSHMSLERLTTLFIAEDLTDCRHIILCHASQGRSDKTVMVDTIHKVTRKPVDMAVPGASFELSLKPF